MKIGILILLGLCAFCVRLDFNGGDFDPATGKFTASIGNGTRTIDVESDNNTLSKLLVFSNTEYPITISPTSNFDITEVLTIDDYYEFRFKIYIYSPHSYIYDLACLLMNIEHPTTTGAPIITQCCARL